jgi:hypothetical protein
MKFDFEKQAFILQIFHETQRVIKVQRAWRTKFKFIDAPRAYTIKIIVSRLEETSSTEKKPTKTFRTDHSTKTGHNRRRKPSFGIS